MRRALRNVSLSKKDREILAAALRELLYVAEEGTIRELCEESGTDPSDAPDASDIRDLLERIEEN